MTVIKKIRNGFIELKPFFILAFPAILEQLLITISNLSVTMSVGRQGNDQLAAVSMINIVFMLMQTVFTGLSIGVTVVVARLTGAREDKKARSGLFQAIVLGLFLFLVFFSLGFVFKEQIVRVFLAKSGAQVFEYGLTYYRIALLGQMCLMFDLIISGALRGAGDTKSPMIGTGLGTFVNIILCILLVPRWGVAGAGVAILVPRVLSSIYKTIVLFARKKYIYIDFKEQYRLDFSMIKSMLSISVPSFLEQGIIYGGLLMMNTIVIGIGTMALSAFNIALSVNSVAFMPVFGFAIAATTVIGQALGAHEYEKAKRLANFVQITTYAVSILSGAIIILFANTFASLYTNETDTLAMATNVVMLYALTQPMMAAFNVCSGILKAGTDVLYVMITSFVGLWLFRVLFAFLLTRYTDLGITGIMIGIFLDYGIRAIMYIVRVQKGGWITRKSYL